jgi:hypothetical protein
MSHFRLSVSSQWLLCMFSCDSDFNLLSFTSPVIFSDMKKCSVETRILRKLDHKYVESFEIWCWRRLEKISWTDRVRNEVYVSQGGEEYHTYSKEEGRVTGLVTFCVGTVF